MVEGQAHTQLFFQLSKSSIDRVLSRIDMSSWWKPKLGILMIDKKDLIIKEGEV